MTAIEKMVLYLQEWQTRPHTDAEVLLEARWLLAREQAQKPMGSETLLREIKNVLSPPHPTIYGSDCDEYWWKGFSAMAKQIKEIIERYEGEKL